MEQNNENIQRGHRTLPARGHQSNNGNNPDRHHTSLQDRQPTLAPVFRQGQPAHQPNTQASKNVRPANNKPSMNPVSTHASMHAISDTYKTQNTQARKQAEVKSSGRGGVRHGATGEEREARIQTIIDYLQQVKTAKACDIARAVGLSINSTMCSPLATTIRRGYVQELEDTGLLPHIYCNTPAGNDMASLPTSKRITNKDINGMPEHVIGVSRIAAALLSPSEQPELYEGMNDDRAYIHDGTAFLVGETLMQSAYRKLTGALKFPNDEARVIIEGYHRQIRNQNEGDAPIDASIARGDAWRYVIPPIIIPHKNQYDNARLAWQGATGYVVDYHESSDTLLPYHTPDLALVYNTGIAVGYELERSAKSQSEYDRIIQSMMNTYTRDIYDQFIWFAENGYICNLIQKSIDKYNARNYIQVTIVKPDKHGSWLMSRGIHTINANK